MYQIENKQKNLHLKAYNILKKSVISDIDSNSCQNLFFNSVSQNNIEINDILTKDHLEEEFLEYMKKIKIPLLLSKIYTILGSSKREWSYLGTTFLNLEQIKKREKIYTSKNQTIMLDLAIFYMGMGYVKVLTLNKQSGELFYRIDGGSCGYSRDAHCKDFLNLKKTIEPIININNFFYI